MPALLQVPYDLLVGADGAGSFVRSAIQQSMPAGYIRRYRHKQMYSMTQMVATDPEVPPHAVFQAHVMANKVATTSPLCSGLLLSVCMCWQHHWKRGWAG